MALAEVAISQGYDNDKIRTESEGEEFIQNEFFTPQEIMKKYKNSNLIIKQQRIEIEKLKAQVEKLKALKNK
jgi:hypothetical protein